MNHITAEILSVGTELLLGTIVNTNAAFLSRELAKLGVAVYSQTTVGDNQKRLVSALSQAFQKADMVITIGGLGPTQDDITKEGAAEYFGLKMVMDEPSLERIKIRFGVRTLPENVEKNALVPETSTTLQNDNGSAPGICIEQNGKILILLPGPPHELEPMFTQYAVPFLRTKTHGAFYSRTLKIIGIGESKVEVLLKDLIDAQNNPTIAPYAKVGEVHVRITASAENDDAAACLIKPIADEIHKRLFPHIYGEDELTLAEAVVNLLKLRGHTLALAESCTGGVITSSLVGVPGCSAVLREGLVTYANESKINRLGVDAATISTYGAVSSQTAAKMAEGAAQTSGTSVALSVTGIAGPEGGTAEKPVGLVYIGLYMEGKETKTAEHRIIGNRGEIRTRAAKLALDMLRQAL